MSKAPSSTLTVDPDTAARLEKRAYETGMTPAQLVAALVRGDDEGSQMDSSDIKELDRQWADIEAGAETVPHAEIKRWLKTWGTSNFKPWPTSR